MGAKFAVAGLGIYVIAVWTAVGVFAYNWFTEPAMVRMVETETSSACGIDCVTVSSIRR
jgi:hypothetical protein